MSEKQLQNDDRDTKMALGATTLPTLYEYYTDGGIVTGLNTTTPQMTLNNRNISIYSGAMHYFRVPKKYWRNRLRKMRAAGLNTVDTYIPWNLHEPEPGKYDFGQGGTDFQEFLDMEEYLRTVQEEDLFAIVRPGPYICSEWDFGGMPSWLLREKDIQVRTSDTNFMKHVTRYFNVLIPLLAALQFTKGGPVIGFQVENEYGSTRSNVFQPDKKYLRQLKELFVKNGIVEQLISSDGTFAGTSGTLPGEFFMTANYGIGGAGSSLKDLEKLQPGRPLMSMEYWSGWFDHWTEKHHKANLKNFRDSLTATVSYPASVSMYMFHGGTNYGFMNGANGDNAGYLPDTTSYDYDCPLNEAGDYTDKYEAVVEVLAQYNPIKTLLPDRPADTPKIEYPTLKITHKISFSSILDTIQPITSENVVSMENLPINNNSGQRHGYIVYQKTNLNIAPNSILKIEGRVCDTLMVRIDGQLITKPLLKNEDLDGFGYWKLADGTLNLGDQKYDNVTLELIVENWGRNNFGAISQFNQKKGLWQGNVMINDDVIKNWNIYPLEFCTSWINSLNQWEAIDASENIENHLGPALYKTILTLSSTPNADTFIDLRDWIKGIVMVNGFVLGRHSTLGPQYFLYLPAPLLKSGDNEIVIFEHFTPQRQLKFSKRQIFTKSCNTEGNLDDLDDSENYIDVTKSELDDIIKKLTS